MVISGRGATAKLIGAIFLIAATLQSPTAFAQALSIDYGYDALGRLTSETYYTGSGSSKVIVKTITYSYDNAGNITTNTVTCGSGGC